MKRITVSAAFSALTLVAFAKPVDLLPQDGAVVPTRTELQKSYLHWNANTWFTHKELFNKLIEGFEKKFPEGKTIHEKVELYVKSLGFTDADIAHFREIMLEKK